MKMLAFDMLPANLMHLLAKEKVTCLKFMLLNFVLVLCWNDFEYVQ